MTNYFISLLLLFSATSYAQYDCNGATDLTDAPFGPYTLVLIKANYPEDGFGVYRLQNKSEDNIIVDGYFDPKKSISNLGMDYYLHPKSLPKKRISFWRLKLKEPDKGWHYLSDGSPISHGYFPSDELVIEPGNYVDLIGKIPHDKEEYIKDGERLAIQHKDGFDQSEWEDYQYKDYAYRIEYHAKAAIFLLSAPYCLKE